MNRIKPIKTLVLLAMAVLTFPSCLDENENPYDVMVPNALVTLKTDATDGTFFMQLDDSTTLHPTNLKESPFGPKEVRAFVNYSQETTTSRNSRYDIHVNWMDSIRTKNMDIHLGSETNALTYGNDPLEIVNDWTTVVEDGYMTLRFRTQSGMGNIHHLHLVKGDTPYEVFLYHHAEPSLVEHVADGIIAFRLNDLPDTEGKTVDLTLRWKSYNGEKSAKFKYCTRP